MDRGEHGPPEPRRVHHEKLTLRMNPAHLHSPHLSRRSLLQTGGLSLGAAALSSLLSRDLSAAASGDVSLPRDPHFAPKAKHVIYLHMIGAPSQ